MFENAKANLEKEKAKQKLDAAQMEHRMSPFKGAMVIGSSDTSHIIN